MGQGGSGKNKRREKRKEGKASGCNNTKCATIELVESKKNVDDHIEFELQYYPNELCSTLETKITKLTINLHEVAQRLIAKHAT